MVRVHYSSLRPFTYINVSGTYAYTTSDKLTCEYMSRTMLSLKAGNLIRDLDHLVATFRGFNFR